MVMFTTPASEIFCDTVFVVDMDGSKLARRYKLSNINFYKYTQSVQACNALYVFFWGNPVRVKKISDFMRTSGPSVEQVMPLDVSEELS